MTHSSGTAGQTAFAAASSATPGVLTPLTVANGGQNRNALLYLPAGHRRPETGWPLVLQLHGRGIDPTRFDRMTGFTRQAEAEGFAVLMPVAIDEAWNDGLFADEPPGADDLAFIAGLVGDAARDAAFDPTRVYAVGMSNGAGMVARLVCERQLPFAAVAQVAGTAAVEMLRACRPAPLPLVQVHGTADPYWPYEGGGATGLRHRLLGGRPRRIVASVDEWARFLAESNDAFGPAAEQVSAHVGVRRWFGQADRAGKASRSDLSFYRVEGGGHTWPGARLQLPALIFGRTERDFDATAAIWRFFAAHTRPSDEPKASAPDRPA